jgi:hypothetical protein
MWPSEVPVSRTYGLSQRAKKRRVVPQNPLGCLSDWKQRKEFGGEGGIRTRHALCVSNLRILRCQGCPQYYECHRALHAVARYRLSDRCAMT